MNFLKLTTAIFKLLFHSNSELENRKKQIRLYGPAHFNYYVHKECAEVALERIKSKGDTVNTDMTRHYQPEELIGKYRDITNCDKCDREFQLTDTEYICYSALKPDELALWKQIQNEEKKS